MDSLVFYTAQEVADLLRLNHQVVLRKLQAGEIPAYKIGREWRVEQSRLLGWLEERSNQRAATPEQRVLATYFDRDGRLSEVPPKRSNRAIVLRRLVESFEPDRTYSEREVSAILRRFHDDVAWIRRELVAMRLLVRTPEGVYRRASAPPPPRG